MDEYWPGGKVAKVLGVSTKTIARWAAAGMLPSPIRIGRQWMYRLSELRSLLDQKAAEQGAKGQER